MTHYPLNERENDRLSDADQACKRSFLDSDGRWHVDRYASQPGWTHRRRAEVVVDGDTVHEHMADAEPFDLWESAATVRCHCGKPVRYGFDGNPDHHRGMCADCDETRCDTYPTEANCASH